MTGGKDKRRKRDAMRKSEKFCVMGSKLCPITPQAITLLCSHPVDFQVDTNRHVCMCTATSSFGKSLLPLDRFRLYQCTHLSSNN